jgi:dTDP-4-dehydrorhamnose 3,5-epimerase-like enzyme
MTLEELKKEFKDQGFRIEGDNFIHEFEDPHTVINGVHPKKRFEMAYVCEGSIRTATDDSDSDTDEYPIYEFDVLGQNREPVLTICFSCFEEFTKLV